MRISNFFKILILLHTLMGVKTKFLTNIEGKTRSCNYSSISDVCGNVSVGPRRYLGHSPIVHVTQISLHRRWSAIPRFRQKGQRNQAHEYGGAGKDPQVQDQSRGNRGFHRIECLNGDPHYYNCIKALH